MILQTKLFRNENDSTRTNDRKNNAHYPAAANTDEIACDTADEQRRSVKYKTITDVKT